MNFVNKYRGFSFEDKAIFTTKFSIISNAIFAVFKIILSIFYGVFFLVAGIINIATMIAKLECYLGIKRPNIKSFKYRNNMISIFLMLAGIEYAIYMSRLIFTDTETMKYSMFLGICIACVSFIEMGFAIKGCFNSFGKGHYYRNTKLISLCSAMNAMVLTEIALMSFAAEGNYNLLNGLFGLAVGIITILIGIYVWFAPKISIVDREHNVYQAINSPIEDNEIIIKLTNSKFYGDYIYYGIKNNNLIDGHIKKGKSPILKWPLWVKILIGILSEILIFPYAFGALIFHFKNAILIKKLDNIMKEKGYKKISEGED